MSSCTRAKRFGFITILICIVFLCVSEPALGQTELIINGSFETGNFNGWTTTQPANPFRPWRVSGAGQGGGFPSVHTTQPQNGNFSAWNGFDAGDPVPAQFTIFQDVTIPAMNSAQLIWKDRVSWNMRDFPGSTQPRLYQVQIRNPSTGAILQTIYSFTAPQATAGDTGWKTHTANLSAYAGQTIRLFFLENIPQNFTGPGQFEIDSISLGVAIPKSRADFDGDGRTDLSVFRPSEGNWYLNRSTAGLAVYRFGIPTDVPVPGDYDGDGKADTAVFRASANPMDPDYYILNSNGFTVTGLSWGLPGDIPVAGGDYNGDGRTDLSVFRPSDQKWYVYNSGMATATVSNFGLATDIPLAMDNDGDGKTNLAVFRPSNNTWYVARPTGNPGTNFDAYPFGLDGDRLTPADYDGDNKDDVAVFRPSEGRWYARLSMTGNTAIITFGASGDIPVPGDYDGNGTDDYAVYRNGVWHVRLSTGAISQQGFGIASDTAIPAKYIP